MVHVAKAVVNQILGPDQDRTGEYLSRFPNRKERYKGLAEDAPARRRALVQIFGKAHPASSPNSECSRRGLCCSGNRGPKDGTMRRAAIARRAKNSQRVVHRDA